MDNVAHFYLFVKGIRYVFIVKFLILPHAGFTDPWGKPDANSLVKKEFLHKDMGSGKNYGGRKNWKPLVFCRIKLCQLFFEYPQGCRLWKTPVEMAVENVEKCEFSTGIPPVSQIPTICG